MKKIIWVCALLLIVSCQQEETAVVENQDEGPQLSQDDQLLHLIKTIATHDGTFDDVVDRSSCFSIDFPYICNANGKKYPVTRAEDLLPFDMYDELIPEFPINVTFANYAQMEVQNFSAFKQLMAQCANGELFDERITCVDLDYPVDLSVYDTVTTDFQTITFEHDMDTFTGIELLEENWVANISYPIVIMLDSGEHVAITSNEQLKFLILAYTPLCD